jgi:transposase
MPKKPIAMDQLKQVLQLAQDGISIKEIVRRTGISRNSVRKYLHKLRDPSGKTLSNKELADSAYNNELLEQSAMRLLLATQFFTYAAVELPKTGVDRQILWKEYLDKHPDGYSYSQFCYHLQGYLKNTDLSMHMEYNPGDMIMVDFAGKKMHYIDETTGECIPVEIFVATLPYSGLIFCYAVHSQKTADLILCFNAMLLFFGGSSATILCDNLKTAVARASKYEPVFTEMCNQLSEHYTTTFSATRPYSPRDKAMVEKAVSIVYTNIYAPLRNRNFTCLKSMNKAIEEQLLLLNDKPYKKTVYSRWYFYELHEKSLLKTLPPEPFVLKKVVMLTVQRNYHVQLSETHHYYSVPYQYVGKKVKVLYDNQVLEIYYEYERIAIHHRKRHQKAYTTLNDHMPPHHQRMKEIKGWNKEDLLEQAGRIGEATKQAAALILDNSIYMEQNYKSCYGMLMLQKKYGTDRLEAACSRSLLGTRINYTMIKNILERGLDKMILMTDNMNYIPNHDNIRGKNHYQ